MTTNERTHSDEALRAAYEKMNTSERHGLQFGLFPGLKTPMDMKTQDYVFMIKLSSQPDEEAA